MTKDLSRRILLGAIMSALATPLLAHNPGENLDQHMFEKENYFQIIDEAQAPSFELQDADGNLVRLSDFEDKVVVMNFVYATCPDVCPLHSQKMAAIQSMINSSAMKDMVQFITVTTDPVNDTPDVMKDYPGWHGLDPHNWTFLTTRPGQAEDATRQLADEYRVHFGVDPQSGTQLHGAVMHVIDIGGRFAAKFHGMEFKNTNAVLYVNGLINNAQHRDDDQGGFWSRLGTMLQ